MCSDSARARSFAESICSAHERLANQQIAFIGSWSARKGAWDWGAIIRQVRRAVPKAKFLFLGTGAAEEIVRRDTATNNDPGIEVRPIYRSSELPELLSGATAGAFPSYIEGFPFAVLEKLAAGLPTVAYDVPGPREMLRGTCVDWLVPKGDTVLFAQRLTEILTANVTRYRETAKQSHEVSGQFNWETIAAETLSIYHKSLGHL
jgi:glycosyltransferase involved in cell wall biosynthesis